MKVVFTKTITVNDADPINISAVFSGDYQKQPEKWQLDSIICDNEIDLLPNLNERGKSWITRRTLKDARNAYRSKNTSHFS